MEHETTRASVDAIARVGLQGVMYIGPWQEYRLAKIQDDAIQRLRQEWEAQLRGQLPAGNDDRIRELMQPLVAKLPSMLLAAKSRTAGSMRNGQSRSGVQSEVGSRCSSRPPSARSNASSVSSRARSNGCGEKNGDTHRHTNGGSSNQDTHETPSSRTTWKPPKPKKKGKKAPLAALEQVQKRKKMFATWIKQAGNGNDAETGKRINSATSREAESEAPEATCSIATKLPLIHSAVPVSAAALLGEHTRGKGSSPLKLPPLDQLSVSTTIDSSSRASAMSPRETNAADIDLDESVDEEEVNNLLNWTDTLLSPQAMDSLCDFDD